MTSRYGKDYDNDDDEAVVMSAGYTLVVTVISMRTASLTEEKQGGFYQNKVTSSLTFIQRPGNFKMVIYWQW